jgi:hypothetical protein
MVPLTELWLPILLSAAAVFIASSIVHMVLKWHASDYPAVPNEAMIMDALRPFALAPGDYMMPRPASMEAMKAPEFIAKARCGRCGSGTIGAPARRSRALWTDCCTRW